MTDDRNTLDFSRLGRSIFIVYIVIVSFFVIGFVSESNLKPSSTTALYNPNRSGYDLVDTTRLNENNSENIKSIVSGEKLKPHTDPLTKESTERTPIQQDKNQIIQNYYITGNENNITINNVKE